MTKEDKEAIAEVLGNGGDIVTTIYEAAFEYSTTNKEWALDFFHKVKRVYEIFELKNPFTLIETVEFSRTFYSMYDKDRGETRYENYKVVEVA